MLGGKNCSDTDVRTLTETLLGACGDQIGLFTAEPRVKDLALLYVA